MKLQFFIVSHGKCQNLYIPLRWILWKLTSSITQTPSHPLHLIVSFTGNPYLLPLDKNSSRIPSLFSWWAIHFSCVVIQHPAWMYFVKTNILSYPNTLPSPAPHYKLCRKPSFAPIWPILIKKLQFFNGEWSIFYVKWFQHPEWMYCMKN
jgi:hypothetical protein